MRYLIGSLVIAFGYLCPTICRADVGEIHSAFEAFLTAPPDDNPPTISPAFLSQMQSDLAAATPEQIESLLPLAKKCLQSSKLTIRRSGLLLFLCASLRLDGAKLLSPYIDDFAALMNQSEVGLKNSGIYFLGASGSAKALEILAAHLNDNGNSAQQTLMISMRLVASSNSAHLHRVLNLVQQQPDLNLKNGVIEAIGLDRITGEEALQLIRSGLNDSDTDTRRVSLDALDRMPKPVRVQFAPELQRLTTLDEVPEIRSRALQVFSSDAP
jgi:hypothetical protein